MSKLFMLAAAATVGAGAASVPASAQDAAVQLVAPQGTILEVSAEGETKRVPDLVTIQAGVVTQAPTAEAAMAQNGAQMNRVLAALRKAGVAERDIQTASLSLSPQYRYAENQPPVVTGYQASNQVSIRFRDLARTGTILDTLVKQGANNIAGPTLGLDKPEAALDEARVDALGKARARADLYARAAGMRIDRILSITEGGASSGPMPVMFARSAKMDAAAPIAPGEQQVSATVTVRYLLK